jgi:hypothetical protein
VILLEWIFGAIRRLKHALGKTGKAREKVGSRQSTTGSELRPPVAKETLVTEPGAVATGSYIQPARDEFAGGKTRRKR